MNAIKITNLQKNYKDFTLYIKELNIPKGYITGFIGPNGSGKTTTINSILGLIKPSSGDINVLDGDIFSDTALKEEIAYVGDTSGFLEESKLKIIKKSIAPFYSNWDEKLYKHYVKHFNLNEDKAFKALSKGQQKQFQLTVALAHSPKLLIMDEPTANLDPLVRSEFVQILQKEIENKDLTVFFSTHITSDLDKAADYIVVIYQGRIVLQGEKDTLLESHRLVKGKKSLLDNTTEKVFISFNKNSFGFEGLVDSKDIAYDTFGDEAIYERCTLEDILLYYTRRGVL